MARKSVTVCSVEEDYIGTFGIGGSDDGQLMWPVSIATDRDDNVYISDEALHRISIFDRDGHFVTKWGVQGSGNGQFDRPAGIAFDSNDNLLVRRRPQPPGSEVHQGRRVPGRVGMAGKGRRRALHALGNSG